MPAKPNCSGTAADREEILGTLVILPAPCDRNQAAAA